jgi:hypothetical protein
MTSYAEPVKITFFTIGFNKYLTESRMTITRMTFYTGQICSREATSKGPDTSDAIRQRYANFQFLKTNKTVNE